MQGECCVFARVLWVFFFFFVSVSVALPCRSLSLSSTSGQMNDSAKSAWSAELSCRESKSSLFNLWLLFLCLAAGCLLKDSHKRILSNSIIAKWPELLNSSIKFSFQPLSLRNYLYVVLISFLNMFLIGTLIVEFIRRFSSEGKESVMWD